MQVLYGCFRNTSGNSLKCCSAHVFVFTLSEVYSRSPVSCIWWMNKQRKETHEVSRWTRKVRPKRFAHLLQTLVSCYLHTLTSLWMPCYSPLVRAHTSVPFASLLDSLFLSKPINIHLGNMLMLMYYIESKGCSLCPLPTFPSHFWVLAHSKSALCIFIPVRCF